ncbi:Gamma-glutamyl cyclotransferase-like [Rhabdaerophilaceae bacterium]
MLPKSLALTPDLVAQTTMLVPDPGLDPSLDYFTDADYSSIVEQMLGRRLSRGPLWLFACGSLIWKPVVEHFEEQCGTAFGWHRSFCFEITRFRATREQPGLMMALDRGGACKGVLFRIDDRKPEIALDKLFRREFTVKPPNNLPRWISVQPATGQAVEALAFVMNRQSPSYLGRLSHEKAADALSRACGPAGSCAEYLYNTVTHLAARGIYDRNLWRLQALVADRIAARNKSYV